MSEPSVTRLVIPEIVLSPAVLADRRRRKWAVAQANRRRREEMMAAPAWFWRYPQSPRLATMKKGA